MSKALLSIALPALALGVALSHMTPEQRANTRAELVMALGGSGPTPEPDMTARSVPLLRSQERDLVSSNATVIDADRLGQYETTMEVAGRALPVLVDTGASFVALTFEDAASIGIHPALSDFRYSVKTANGIARAASATVSSIRVGNVEAFGVPVIVSEAGALTGRSLLGMSFLRKLSGFQVQSNRLVLKQ